MPILGDVTNLSQPNKNFMVDGKCNGCVECCSIMTPVTRQEYKKLKKLWKKEFKTAFVEKLDNGTLDIVCPFSSEKGCSIYKDRPSLCKAYRCDGKGVLPSIEPDKYNSSMHTLYGYEFREMFRKLESFTT